MHALLYRPDGRSSRPPLIVHLHGGPTGQALADWNARVQWLVAARVRGAATQLPRLDGYGRAYTQALAGRWGDRDVADVAAGIRHAVKEGWGDPAPRRADGRERGRLHRAARRGASTPTSCAA